MTDASQAAKSKRTVYILIAILVLGVLWYAFRPEKLFLNKKATEATQTTGQLTPIFSGPFQGEVHKTSGVATVYQKADGSRILRLTNFSTSNGPALHMLLVESRGADTEKDFSLAAVKNIDLGDLKGNLGDQEYAIPNDADLQKFSNATVYCERFHANFGTAILQKP